MKMLSVSDPSFAKYGQVLNIDTSSFVDYLENKSQMPTTGNIYVRNDINMFSLKGKNEINEAYYGNAEIEIGYCNGFNSKLNCLENHTCPEVDIAGTDLVLLLALPSDIVNEKIDSKKVKAFYLKKGDAVLLYPYTFHFSPCKVNKNGFRSAIILSKGTNEDLKNIPSNKKLWKVNKWLYAHKDSEQAKLGAYIGIEGINLEVDYL